jgi:hypothetical protein
VQLPVSVLDEATSLRKRMQRSPPNRRTVRWSRSGAASGRGSAPGNHDRTSVGDDRGSREPFDRDVWVGFGSLEP